MQRHSTTEAVMPSVRLYPRLVAKPAHSVVNSGMSDRAQLRARLLRMILDNERSRRDGRPTAG
jgi:hypothetical protein